MISFKQFFYEVYLGTDVPKVGGGKTLPVADARIRNTNRKNDKNSSNQDARLNKWPTGRKEESQD